MVAQGKINASTVTTVHRILVKVVGAEVVPSNTKTGENVHAVRVLDKWKCSDARGYIIETSLGEFYAEPIQTMWLVPTDPAGIKRAHVEALKENTRRTAEAIFAATMAEEVSLAHAEALGEDSYRESEKALAEMAEEFTPEERAEIDASLKDSGVVDDAHAEALAENAEREALVQAELDRVAEIEFLEAQYAAELLAEAEAAQTENLAEYECALCGGPLASDGVCADDTCGDEGLTLNSHDGKVNPMSENETTEPTETETPEILGSEIVATIEKVWARLRTEHPEIPHVVVVTGSGIEMLGAKWGHFRPRGWKPAGAEMGLPRDEFFLAGEAMAKSPRQVLQTTIHEAAHALANRRGVQDTSRQGRWHNGEFRKIAEELGLEYKHGKADKALGFSGVTLTEATIERYADLLAELETEIKMTCHLPGWLGGTGAEGDDEDDRGGEKITGPKKPKGEGKSSLLKAVCRCEEPSIIRVSRKVLDTGTIRCDDCEELFAEA